MKLQIIIILVISYIYGKSEIANGGRTRAAILADAVEAIIGAIYLESGFTDAEAFVIINLDEKINEASKSVGLKDYKTVLQEKLQVNGDISIEYSVIEEFGPDHDKLFTVELKINEEAISTGQGKTKKDAEMDAARKALEK